MPRRTKKFANFLNRAAHMNKVRKIKNIPLHDALAEQQQQQDETRANKTLEDVEQNDHLFDLPETSADDGCNINTISNSVSDSPADTTTIDQNAEVQVICLTFLTDFPKRRRFSTVFFVCDYSAN
nr:uncharacterized protein LOC126057080 [Helicoverpa armigera]